MKRHGTSHSHEQSSEAGKVPPVRDNGNDGNSRRRNNFSISVKSAASASAKEADQEAPTAKKVVMSCTDGLVCGTSRDSISTSPGVLNASHSACGEGSLYLRAHQRSNSAHHLSRTECDSAAAANLNGRDTPRQRKQRSRTTPTFEMLYGRSPLRKSEQKSRSGPGWSQALFTSSQTCPFIKASRTHPSKFGSPLPTPICFPTRPRWRIPQTS